MSFEHVRVLTLLLNKQI